MGKVAEIKEILEKRFDRQVDFGKEEEQEAKYEAAVAMFRKGEFSRAADLFMQAAAVSLRGRSAPDALKLASVCMYKVGRYLEAMAVADFLGDWWPKQDAAQTALFNLGVTLAKEAKKHPKGSAEAASFKDDSNIVFTKFVRIAPRHPKAAWAAYRVAEYQYARGTALRKEKKALEKKGAPVKEVNAKIEEMRAAFLAAVPIYEILTEHYGSSDQGAKAYYKLGWIYHIVDDGEKAAQNFLEYCAAEERPVEQKVEAKFFAADRLMRAGQVDEAIFNFGELLDWTKADSPFPKTEQVKGYRETAEGLLAWAYDKKYRQLLEQIAAIEERLSAPAGEAPKSKPEEKAPAPKQAADDDAADAGPKAVEIEEEAPEVTKARLEQAAKDFYSRAVTTFRNVIKKYPKSDQTPANMGKLGALFLEKKDYANGAKWLARLSTEFPASEPARQGLFSLGRAYCETKEWGKASAAFKKLIPNMKDMPTTALLYIAGKLFKAPPNETELALDVDVVLEANKEVLRRSETPSHADYQILQSKRERALFRFGEAHAQKGDLDKAVESFDRLLAENKTLNDRLKKEGKPERTSPYYYDILFRKGEAYRAGKQYDLSVRSYDEILTYLPVKKNPGNYYRAVAEAGRSLLLKETLKDTKKAAARFQQIVQFADPAQKGVEEWLEVAYYEGARALALIGDSEGANKLKDEYRGRFPKGTFREKILSLPPRKFREPAPAAPVP